MREVAVHAQVSVGTVLNALSRPHVVAQTTLERVQAAIEELGFVRNDLARQLRMGGGKTLGMIMLNMANPFFAGLAQACEAAAEEVGYTVQLGSSDQLRERENRYVDLFEEQRVGGMIHDTRGVGDVASARKRSSGVTMLRESTRSRSGVGEPCPVGDHSLSGEREVWSVIRRFLALLWRHC